MREKSSHTNFARIGALLCAIAGSLASVVYPSAASSSTASKQVHSITWDSHSLMIDAKRVFVWAGEFHPFRLPSPSLWRDILQKMKAIGYNTVTYYIPWGYYSPAPGVYDFSGIRDVDLALRMAEEAGLYVIVRPGPYVNSELSRGGFPGWLVNQRARARTDAPEYLATVDEWFAHVNPILARHQITNGGGSVIAYQIENELLETTPSQVRYMQHLYARARADGITVPIFHNDIGRNGFWVPPGTKVPQTIEGPTDLYAWDSYPGGSCRYDASPSPPREAPDFGWYGPGGAKGGSSASPATPGFTAEFGGGWFDYWGSNGNYPCIAKQLGSGYERVFYGTNIANGLTIQNIYMAFGGTSWGWQPESSVYTSYDYGAGIDEARGLRDKALVLKQLGQFVEAAGGALLDMHKGPALKSSSSAVKLYHNVSAGSGVQLIVAMHNPSSAVTKDSFTFSLDAGGRTYTVPQSGEMRLDGQDAKLLLASFALERQELVYSTSELQTAIRKGDTDVALFYGRAKEDGETVLRYPSEPRVDVLEGNVASAYDAAKGDLRLDYVHGGLARVRITSIGHTPLLLLLADEGQAQSFWRQSTSAGDVIERGPALVRSAAVSGSSLALTGDTNASSPLEVWAPPGVTHLTWNGQAIAVRRTASDSLVSTALLAGPDQITLPDISAGTWRQKMGSPEADPNFDDANWKTAVTGASSSTTKPASGQAILTMDDYGFHDGDVWYRGRYTGDGASSRLELYFGAGGAGLLQVWVDGHFIGENELASGQSRPLTTGSAVFTLPSSARAPGAHLISAMVRSDGHNWDLFADDAHKEGRGLISVSLSTNSGSRFAVPIAWKIQGNAGGEKIADAVRGVMNNGGQYGERGGWHLPGFSDTKWERTAPDAPPLAAGTMWLRTQFHLNLPKADDVQLGLAFGNADNPRSDRTNRALIFVNGWNMGQFISNVGPQRVFVIPPGIVNSRGRNTLALAVTTDGNAANALEHVTLVTLRIARGGVPVEMVSSPRYQH